MIKKLIYKLLNTKVLILDNALVFYIVEVKDNSLFTEVNFRYTASYGNQITATDIYELDDKVTLNHVLSIYKELTNYYNGVLKINE